MAMAKADTGELFLSRHTETYICRPGENVLLECYVRHQRVKSINWYANGELVEVRGFRLWHRYQPTTGKCSLYIRSVLYSDEGSYCCEATSIDGDIETLEIKLSIQNYDKSWTKIPVLHMAGRVTPEIESDSNTIFLTSQPSSDTNMFPIHWYELRIDRPLLNPTISLENTSLQLSCRIAGLHVDKFEWFKNGELIAICGQTPPSSLVTSNLHTHVNDRGSFHASYDTLPAHFIPLLNVDQTTKQRHEGTYECRASNAHYQVSSSCEVIIKSLEPKSQPTTSTTTTEQIIPNRDLETTQPTTLAASPVESRFRTLGDQIVPANENKKDTNKTVKWSEQIQTVQEITPMQQETTAQLSLPETIPSDETSSSSVSSGDLEQVLGSHSFIISHLLERSLDTSSSSETHLDSIGMAPVFFQLLPSNIECEEGERLLLTCQVMVGTQCQIRWFNNETIISENASRTRRHYNPDTGICFLIIDPTQTTDTGIYRLVIVNRSGQAQSTCQVRILARQLPAMPDDNLSTRLYFFKPLPSTPVLCRDGDTIQLTCIVHGKRPIDIHWYKDEREITINQNQQTHTHQLYFDSLTGKSTLTIYDIYPHDSGVYRCEAINEQGKESTTTTIDVSSYRYENDSEMSSASFVSGPPSEHEDMTESQLFYSTDDKAVFDESRRLHQELDARIAELSSEKQPGNELFS